MVDWRLLKRAGGRYTLLYGGATAGLAAAVGRGVAMIVLVLVGLLLLVFVAGGVGSVRMGTVATNHQPMGLSIATTDPAEKDEFHRTIDADLKLLFYAVGLLVFGFLGMVVLG